MLKIKKEAPDHRPAVKVPKPKAVDLDDEMLVKREQPDAVQDAQTEQQEAVADEPEEPLANEQPSDEVIKSYFDQELELFALQDQIANQHSFEFIFDQQHNYKQNYYTAKFNVSAKNYDQFTALIKKYYIEGLVWNFAYYYKGCVSWDYFYPFYYAPLLSDMYNFAHYEFTFAPSAPLRPIEQLLAVLPPYSSHALPDAFKPLMLDDKSEIIDFYPSDFVVDVKGKRFAWLGEVILPFIDSERLRAAIASREAGLSEKERERNTSGYIVLLTKEERTAPKLPVGDKQDLSEDQVLTLEEFKVERHSIEQINFYRYSVPEYREHLCMPLSGTRMPKNEFYYTVS